MTDSGDELTEVDPFAPVIMPTIQEALRRAAARTTDQAKQLFVGSLTRPEVYVPLGELSARKIVGYQQIAFDREEDDWWARAVQYRRERQALIDANLATHTELLRLHPGDTIPRAFLLAHRPHQNDDGGERTTICLGCPETWDSYDTTEPAEWPCGPWQLVNERTPR